MSNPSPATPLKVGGQAALVIGALGVVFGDIGTSPLYALRECLATLPPVERTQGILGVLSLVFWALTFEVGFKYLGFIMRADNDGEGGVLALTTRVLNERPIRGTSAIAMLGLAGCALFYGDGVIKSWADAQRQPAPGQGGNPLRGRCGRSGNKRDSAAPLRQFCPRWRRPDEPEAVRQDEQSPERSPAVRERQLFRNLPRGLGGDVRGQSRACAGLRR